jgi:hypothetical protein
MAAYIEQAPVPDLLSCLNRVLELWKHPDASLFVNWVDILCYQLTGLIGVEKESSEFDKVLEEITQTIEKIHRSCLYFETVIAFLWNRKKLGLKTEKDLVKNVCEQFQKLVLLQNV